MTETESVYLVKTEKFEGPFEILLNLIEKRKLFINEISLSGIAEDYMAEIRGMENKAVKDMTAFVVIASILILIKSKSLLPNLKLTIEEDGDISELENRLKLYEIIKSTFSSIESGFLKSRLFQRSAKIAPKQVVFSPDKNITSKNIFLAAKYVLDEIPKEEKIPEHTVEKVITLDKMINNLVERIEKGMQTNFTKISSGSGHKTPEAQKVHAIVSFLALLELVREGILDVVQSDDFTDITIQKI
jgi:segregation and condensation protein A